MCYYLNVHFQGQRVKLQEELDNDWGSEISEHDLQDSVKVIVQR